NFATRAKKKRLGGTAFEVRYASQGRSATAPSPYVARIFSPEYAIAFPTRSRAPIASTTQKKTVPAANTDASAANHQRRLIAGHDTSCNAISMTSGPYSGRK